MMCADGQQRRKERLVRLVKLEHSTKRLLEERLVVDTPIGARVAPLESGVSNELLEASLLHELVLQHEAEWRGLDVGRGVPSLS